MKQIGLRPLSKLDLAPVSPATPQGDKKRQHPTTLTEKETNERFFVIHLTNQQTDTDESITLMVEVKNALQNYFLGVIYVYMFTASLLCDDGSP